MLAAVRGIYRQGRIELAEDAKIATEAAVVVTFLEDRPLGLPPPAGRIMTSGMLAVPGKPMSVEADFASVEFDDSGWTDE